MGREANGFGGAEISCDFCEASIDEKKLNEAGTGWSFGHKGEALPFGPYCRVPEKKIKHSCPDKVCQAKLLAWARS